MEKEVSKSLTSNDLMYILIGSMVGVGVLSLPASLVTTAKQDSWIAAGLGAIYPLFFAIVGSFMHKRFPDKSILELSKRYYGKYLGTIMNIIFISFFIIYSSAIVSGLGIYLKIYISEFLSINKILIMIIITAAYTSYKGLGTISRICKVIFYFTAPMYFITVAALQDGSILNVMPVFKVPFPYVVSAGEKAASAYEGVEIILVLYPFMKKNESVKKPAVSSAVMVGLIYIWITFITIYYLGIDIIPKYSWPFIAVTEAFKTSAINNFRYVFLFLWSIKIIKTLGCSYYAASLSLNYTIKKLDIKKISIVLIPVIFLLSMRLSGEASRVKILGYTGPGYAIYNIFYALLVTLAIIIKGDKLNEE